MYLVLIFLAPPAVLIQEKTAFVLQGMVVVKQIALMILLIRLAKVACWLSQWLHLQQQLHLHLHLDCSPDNKITNGRLKAKCHV